MIPSGYRGLTCCRNRKYQEEEGDFSEGMDQGGMHLKGSLFLSSDICVLDMVFWASFLLMSSSLSSVVWVFDIVFWV